MQARCGKLIIWFRCAGKSWGTVIRAEAGVASVSVRDMTLDESPRKLALWGTSVSAVFRTDVPDNRYWETP